MKKQFSAFFALTFATIFCFANPLFAEETTEVIEETDVVECGTDALVAIYDAEEGTLSIPCVDVEGAFYEVVMERRGKSFNWEVVFLSDSGEGLEGYKRGNKGKDDDVEEGEEADDTTEDEEDTEVEDSDDYESEDDSTE